jgi:hypothetical protein
MLDFLKEETNTRDTDHDIYAWHLNYQTILRKKFMVLMNDLTRYCVVLYGVKKSDLKEPIDFFRKSIMIAMAFDGLPQDLVLKYINGIKEVTYGKTKDRKLVAQLNRAMLDAEAYAYDALYDQIYQPEISGFLNRTPVGTNHWKEVHYPIEKMLEYLELV